MHLPMATMTTIPTAKSLCDLEKMLPDEAAFVGDGLGDEEVAEVCCVDVVRLLPPPRLDEAVSLEAEEVVVGASVALLVAAEEEEEVVSEGELAVSKLEEETPRLGVERVDSAAVVVLAAAEEAAELADFAAVTAATTGVATVGTTATGVLTEAAVAFAFTIAGTLTTMPAPAPTLRTAVGLAMAWRTSRSRLQRLWPAIS